MKKLITLLAMGLGLSSTLAQNTVITYQGRLNDGVNPANGSYDLRFALFDALTLGNPVGTPLTNSPVNVTNGLFTVTLDFGNQFPGADRWLEIGVRTNGAGGFSTVSPRQKLTPTPYAVTAGNLSGSLPASQLSGAVSLTQLPAGVVTNGASNLNLTGTFTGNAAGMTNVPFGALNSAASITWPGYFSLATSPGVGSIPESLVAADVNGDGKLDLISANFLANTLTVLTNNGSGGFALASSPGVGLNPYSVAAADVNGDGKVDLISANFSDNTLTVLTNNGSGGFALCSSPAVGGHPQSVVAADVNGDGKVDLISANSGADTLTVLTNNGSGGFVLASSPGVGLSPFSVVAADVNSDGKVDLLSANSGDNTLTVLTNNGSGGFALTFAPGVGNTPISITAADVNGDGKLDLISANYNASTLTVLTNNGSGGFLIASSPGVGNGPASVAVADVNGDGKVDLTSANLNASTLTVLTNNGSGGFALCSSPAVGLHPQSVVAADVNGDGKVDLISANRDADTLTVLFNTSTFTGSFTGNGSGLISLNATEVTSGTLSDARLSANVALLNANQTFTGNNVFNNPLGIGTSSPGATVDMLASQATGRFTSTANGNGSVITLKNTTASPTYLGAINFENSGGTPGQIGYLAGDSMIFRVGNVQRVSLDGSGNLSFGSQTRQMLNLWSTGYGIGVQTATTYFRSGGGFSWFNGGVHNDGQNNAGGGAELMRLTSGGNLNIAGTFGSLSDRNVKQDFEPVNSRAVLEKVAALPLARWSYKADASNRHIGPMAQDFYAAFGVGTDDKHIATVDADGVALAAIQGLNEKLEARSQKLVTENAELRRELADLKEVVQMLARARKE